MRERTYAPNNLKKIRKARGVTLDELAARMVPESTASTIAKLENRVMGFTLDYVLSAARALGVQPSEIVEEGGIQTTRVLPVIGSISAGSWQEAVVITDEFMPVPSHLKGANLFVLRPDGTSMNLICTGPTGFVVVDPDQRDLVDGKTYALMNGDGETTWKSFSAGTMQLLPCSTDPAHQPISIGSTPFTVIGRVIYAGQEL